MPEMSEVCNALNNKLLKGRKVKKSKRSNSQKVERSKGYSYILRPFRPLDSYILRLQIVCLISKKSSE